MYNFYFANKYVEITFKACFFFKITSNRYFTGLSSETFYPHHNGKKAHWMRKIENRGIEKAYQVDSFKVQILLEIKAFNV